MIYLINNSSKYFVTLDEWELELLRDVLSLYRADEHYLKSKLEGVLYDKSIREYDNKGGVK